MGQDQPVEPVCLSLELPSSRLPIGHGRFCAIISFPICFRQTSFLQLAFPSTVTFRFEARAPDEAALPAVALEATGFAVSFAKTYPPVASAITNTKKKSLFISFHPLSVLTIYSVPKFTGIMPCSPPQSAGISAFKRQYPEAGINKAQRQRVLISTDS